MADDADEVLDELHKSCLAFACKQFMGFCSTERFLTLELTTLKGLLECDELEANEDAVLNAVSDLSELETLNSQGPVSFESLQSAVEATNQLFGQLLHRNEKNAKLWRNKNYARRSR